MPETPQLISIVVPIYNGMEYLDRCLGSLAQQSYSRLEIILVDDGSTDASRELCRKWCRQDPRFHLVCQSNAGVSQTRNRGMDLASGSYLTFLDADDWVEPDYCQCLYDLLTSHNAQLAYCSEVYQGKAAATGQIHSWSGETYHWLLPQAHQTCWGALYHLDLWSGLRFRADLSTGEDSLFFAQAVSRAQRIVFQDVPLYHYTFRPGSAVNRPFDQARYSELTAWQEICRLFEADPCRHRLCRGAYAYRCGMMLRKYACDPVFLQKYRSQVKREYQANLLCLLEYQLTHRQWTALGKELLYSAVPVLWKWHHRSDGTSK